MKTYTLGEVIDNMQVGEVAIKVKGKIADDYDFKEGYVELGAGLFFDENDGGILKSLRGADIAISKSNSIVENLLFVVMPRDVYEKLVNK